MKNGNGNKWTFWLVATLWSVIMAVILFMGNTVKANDVKRETGDMNIKEKHTTDILEIKEDISDIKIQQMQSKTILERIDRKL